MRTRKITRRGGTPNRPHDFRLHREPVNPNRYTPEKIEARLRLVEYALLHVDLEDLKDDYLELYGMLEEVEAELTSLRATSSALPDPNPNQYTFIFNA